MRRWILMAVTLTALACAPLALAAASPAVSTTATTSIGQTSATLNGTVDPEGTATTYQFNYGTSTSLGTYAPLPAASAGSGNTAVAEHAALKGLVPGTTYYFELVATSSAGTSTTPVATFKTTGYPPPMVSTGASTAVERYQATMTGTIQPNDEATTYYFQYGLTASYGFQTSPASVPAGAAPVAVSTVVNGLEPGVTFHYRLVAVHGSTPTVYGTDQSFQTLPWPRPQTPFSFSVTPRRARRAPYRFLVSGSIGIPLGTAPTLACAGSVRLTLMDHGRTLATRTVLVNSDCSYTGNLRIKRLPRTSRHGASTQLSVSARYEGDTYVAPSSTDRASVTVR